jgi:hypothetical protein
MERGVFVERPMSPQRIVVGSILRQNPTQVRFTQNDYMVDTLAPDRSDQPFGEAVLPRRGWGDGLVTDAHGAHSTCEDGAVEAIPIADQVVRGLIPWECFWLFGARSILRSDLP